jgi:pyruvate formate lyase activating enzyme
VSQNISTIDRDTCSGCGACVEVCPNRARRLAGRYMTQDEVLSEVLPDRAFYKNSGGGVTLSGGEATSQFVFSLALLKECKEQGLHTVLDTCGYVAGEKMERLLEYVDLVFFDIKCKDAEKHRKATGLSNDLILENAKRVARLKPMKIRVPLIPGFNDSEDEIKAIAEFVKSELGTKEIDLLAYNNLGEAKFEHLDKPTSHLERQSEEHIQHLKSIVSSLS